MIRSHSSSVRSQMGLRTLSETAPALLNSTSILPNRSRQDFIRLATWAESVTSVATAMALTPRLSASAAASSMGPVRRPAMTRSAPARAMSRTIARPRPVPPPVMTTDLPSRLSDSSIQSSKRQYNCIDYQMGGFFQSIRRQPISPTIVCHPELRPTVDPDASGDEIGQSEGSRSFGQIGLQRGTRFFPDQSGALLRMTEMNRWHPTQLSLNTWDTHRQSMIGERDIACGQG